MNQPNENLWLMRREEEKRSGQPVKIYSAYPLIGRGSVIHDLVSHEEVETRFEKALHLSAKYKIPRWVRRILPNG